MDSGDDCTAFHCKIFEDLYYASSSEGVQASSRLIKEDEVGICDELYSNRASLSLSTRDSFYKWPSDFGLGCLDQLQVFKDQFYPLFDVDFGWELELSSEHETLSHSHSLEENVILLYIGTVLREVDLLSVYSIHSHLSLLL
jgi:hypothetical protein